MEYQAYIHIEKKTSVHDVFFSIEHSSQNGLKPRQNIVNIEFRINGDIFAQMASGEQLSRNPSISVQLKEAQSGDTVSVHWIDSNRERGNIAMTISE